MAPSLFPELLQDACTLAFYYCWVGISGALAADGVASWSKSVFGHSRFGKVKWNYWCTCFMWFPSGPMYGWM